MIAWFYVVFAWIAVLALTLFARAYEVLRRVARVLLAVGLLTASMAAQTNPVVVQTTVSCATSVDGSVVGVLNPLNPPVVAAGFSGTLPAGNYYTQIAWYDAAGHVTLVGPEVQTQLSATGQLQVNLPTSGKPAAAVGMNVYIGAASGTETLQGQTTGAATFTQSVPLTSGTAEPATNTTVCAIVANDAGWPTGTGYQVSMTTAAGNTMPGWPMQWQLLGPGTTQNLSNGLPLYNGTVTYPIPILARPYNHATQSISGSLAMTNYNITQVGKLGVGTNVPVWPIDVENGAVNASGGYIVNGGTGITTGQCLAAGSDPYHTFNVTVNCIGSVPTSYYQTVAANGSAQTQRPTLNFLPRLTVADSGSPSETNIDLATVTSGGTFSPPTSITVDVYGRVTSVTAGSAANRTCSGTQCYRIDADGTIEEWGYVSPFTSHNGSLTVTFPYAFSSGAISSKQVSVQIGLDGRYTTGSDSGAGVWAVGLSTSGFTAECEIDTGVGSAGAYWYAVGY